MSTATCIALAQIRPKKGDVAANVEKHIRFANIARQHGATAVFFPELSLTSYEPELAEVLAFQPDDPHLKAFQQISLDTGLTMGIGLPLRSPAGIHITMAIFQPGQPVLFYHKQQLHRDEEPFFVPGKEQVLIGGEVTSAPFSDPGSKSLIAERSRSDQKNIAPAICYESLQPDHAERAAALGATVYLASVAKPMGGVAKAYAHYPDIARRYQMPVLMVNSVGFCDNFLSVGQSAVWSASGELLGKLDDRSEGLLMWDQENGEEVVRQVKMT